MYISNATMYDGSITIPDSVKCFDARYSTFYKMHFRIESAKTSWFSEGCSFQDCTWLVEDKFYTGIEWGSQNTVMDGGDDALRD